MTLNYRDFWEIKHLKPELATHAISENKVFCYSFAITVFDWLQFTAVQLSPTSEPISYWARADVLLTVGITILG